MIKVVEFIVNKCVLSIWIFVLKTNFIFSKMCYVLNLGMNYKFKLIVFIFTY